MADRPAAGHQIQARPAHYEMSQYKSSGPSASQVLAVVTLLPVGGCLLALAGLTLVGSLIGLAVATPLFVIFSPVLVPAVSTLGLAVTAILASGGFGVTALSSLSYVANYVRQAIVSLPEFMDMAKRRLTELVAYGRQKMNDVGQTVQSKAHEAGKETGAAGTYDRDRAAHYDMGQYKGTQSSGPSVSQILAVVTLLPVGGSLLCLAGLTLVGSLIGLAVATPLFVIFSPVIVPAALTIGLAVTAFMASGAFGITALSSLSYVANCIRQAIGSVPEQMDMAKKHMMDLAEYTGEKTKDAGQAIKSKAQEARKESASGGVEGVAGTAGVTTGGGKKTT